jgi:hypothetical protein
MPEDGDLPRPVPRADIPRELAVVPVPAGGHDPQLEQVRGAQARFNEGAGALEPIRRDIGQAWAGQPPAGEIRHLPQGFQHRVADDARVRPPPASSGVGQNLAAAAMLLRVMPEPSTTEGRRIQGSSRISWKAPRSDAPRALPPEGKDTPRNLMSRLPDSCGKPRSTPGARATPRLRPQAASATSTIIATVGPTSTRGCVEAITPGVGDATTAGRIGVPRSNHPVCRPSAGPSDGHHSRPGSDPRLQSQSTRGDETGTVARGLPSGLPTRWNGRRQPHHLQPPPVPLRHRSRLVGAPAPGADLQLG